ncbi:MAG: hypothetical protein A2Z25_10670 [Planctomycetes bacterium RBG_16_55_9]|nr:MAG: hypothetical protein A2Z25_10670 [Planctomycetes bacterium RBG_16_55_9]
MRRNSLSIRSLLIATGLGIVLLNSWSWASLYNVKVVTDASPDYYDVAGLVHSITSRWEKDSEKCWAMFYWNHMARRQTSPMIVHGVECTDPIRQFNDYGYTMCSTIAGINCSIWNAMGYPAKFWDISAHTVPEVYYEGRWHIYDNSMSALYTLCDGVTIAGVEDVGASAACSLSGEIAEPGHVAKYHCLTANGPKSFLTGADCPRDLEQEYRCFNPNGLKYRYYYFNWDRGHRYILNLRENETYTRYYHSRGDAPSFYVPNNGKDPEAANRRYRIRGNGLWRFHPALTAESLKSACDLHGCRAGRTNGVVPTEAGQVGYAVFKIQGANVITSMNIKAAFFRRTPADLNRIEVSTTNGLTWNDVWTSQDSGQSGANLELIDEVNGTYEVLVRVSLMGAAEPSDSRLEDIAFKTTTMLNSKTQPQLLLGTNTVYVGLGEQTDTVVLWPDLRGENYKPYIVDERNVVAEPKHPGYQGVLHAVKPDEDAYVVFKIDTPGDVTGVTYGGRFYNRAPRSRIELLHSCDGGRTWQSSYSLTKTDPPWDVIHFETITDVPSGCRSVLCKYLLNSSSAGTSACSIYSVRMEAKYRPADADFKPLEVTYNWSEVQPDYSLVERSHTQLVASVPFTYQIHVGGADHPVVNALSIALKGTVENVKYGYSDGKEAAGPKFVPRWVTYGRNLAKGAKYSVSVPSKNSWGAGDPDGRKLTDGITGPPYAGGIGPRYALCWDKADDPVIDLDLGAEQMCGAFRIHLSAGWPWWDALKGQVKDTVEVQTSRSGHDFTSQGFFSLNLRRKDIPINHLMPDDETATGFTYDLIPKEPVNARFVRFKIAPQRTLTVSEIQVLDSIRYEPFDLRIALPE